MDAAMTRLQIRWRCRYARRLLTKHGFGPWDAWRYSRTGWNAWRRDVRTLGKGVAAHSPEESADSEMSYWEG